MFLTQPLSLLKWKSDKHKLVTNVAVVTIALCVGLISVGVKMFSSPPPPQIVTKLKLKLWPYSKTWIMKEKLKKTQTGTKLKFWQISNYDKTWELEL